MVSGSTRSVPFCAVERRCRGGGCRDRRFRALGTAVLRFYLAVFGGKCSQRGSACDLRQGFEGRNLESGLDCDFRQGKCESENYLGRERCKAAERERSKRTVRELVGKVKAAGALRSFRQRNFLAFSCLLKAILVEIQLSLAFWRLCSKRASREAKVSFSYQDLNQAALNRESAMNSARESTEVRKARTENEVRQLKENEEGELERNQQAKSRQQVLLGASGRETPLQFVTCPRQNQPKSRFPLLFGEFAQKVLPESSNFTFPTRI
ncbi:Hypothetical_protein [Hexamita inflata]|uniref:Hypothetical_protein n=1 Tax=Hexamita inflata TaxID=28002 RepID=A0AA86RKZ2_9EUKA|nr:Hypothetical protein HINF_LOCUS66252 [Hexamita inflata]